MHTDASTPEDYLKSLPDDRHVAMAAVREIVLAHLPEGMVETVNWGMLSYEVPLTLCSDTYNGKPLSFAGLASQKNHMALYLSGIYADEGLREEFEAKYRATGRRMDVGKSCVRFRTLDDLPLDVVGWAIGAMTTQEFIATYLQARESAARARVRKST